MTEPFSSIAVDITRGSTYFKIELNGSVILFLIIGSDRPQV